MSPSPSATRLRVRCESRHERGSGEARRALDYPLRVQRGRGPAPGAAGWGWGPGLCPLSLSLPLSRATGRNPTPTASQAASAGQAPPPGSFNKSRPDLPVVRAVTEVVLWGRGLPACEQACKHLSGNRLGVGSREGAGSGAAEAGGEKMAREATFLRDLGWAAGGGKAGLGWPPTEKAGTGAWEWDGAGARSRGAGPAKSPRPSGRLYREVVTEKSSCRFRGENDLTRQPFWGVIN